MHHRISAIAQAIARTDEVVQIEVAVKAVTAVAVATEAVAEVTVAVAVAAEIAEAAETDAVAIIAAEIIAAEIAEVEITETVLPMAVKANLTLASVIGPVAERSNSTAQADHHAEQVANAAEAGTTSPSREIVIAIVDFLVYRIRPSRRIPLKETAATASTSRGNSSGCTRIRSSRLSSMTSVNCTN